MKPEYNIDWSTTSKIITVAVIAVVAFAGYELYRNNSLFHTMKGYLYWVMVFVLMCVAVFIPRRIVLDSDSIRIERILGTKIIPLGEISEAGLPYFGGMKLKTFGSGGFCGNLGWYHADGFGNYFSYVMDSKQSFYIILNNDRRYMLSCRNAPELVKELQAKLPNK